MPTRMDESPPGNREPQEDARLDLNALGAWGLCLGLVLFLGLQGDGFQITLFGPVGIVGWWIVALGLVIGFLPGRRPEALTWTSLALFGAFLAWMALGLSWTDSADKSLVEVARTSTYLAVFSLLIFGFRRNVDKHIVSATASAVAILAFTALLSRYFPTLFPSSSETGRFLTSEAERLTFPLSYWNGLAALLAIGAPLLIQTATGAKYKVARCLASASLPVLFLALYLTLSRGGLLAATVAVGVYLAFSYDRLPRFATLVPALMGGIVLVHTARGMEAFESGLQNELAKSQGSEMFILTAVVCLVVGLVQLVIAKVLSDEHRPTWSRVGPRPAALVCTAGAIVLVFVGIALGAPERTADAWSGFKSSDAPSRGSERLVASAGNGRYQYWSSAIEQFRSEPITGTGAGTFEYWWSRNGDRDGFVRDAHSLYAQTLGETGLVGFALLMGFLLTTIAAGVNQARRNRDESSSWLAASLGGCGALLVTAAFDWVWQIPVIVITFLFLASTLVGFRPSVSESETTPIPMPFFLRIALATLAVVATFAVFVPWASSVLLDSSRSEARAGNLTLAIDTARMARWFSPNTSAPLLQEAQLLELSGQSAMAIAAAERATSNDSANWRAWLILSGIQLRAGQERAAVTSFQKAESLNPRSTIFDR